MSNKWVAALAGFCLCCILLLCLAVSRDPPRPCVCADPVFIPAVQPPVESKRIWYDGMLPKVSTPGGRE